MIDMESFRDIMDEIIETIPEKYFIELNGGVLLSPRIKYHPKGLGTDLVIMGEYHRSQTMGRTIYLYYGSFRRIYNEAPEEELNKQIRETILHELTHHLESLAGEKDLEIQDAVQLKEYEARKKNS